MMGKKSSILVFILLSCALVAIAGAAAVDISVVWNTTYGEPGANDSAYSIVQASGDRGYLFAGETGSFGAGETDAWLVNRTGSGDERWNRTYGGPEKDTARALINTSDGNLLFAGTLTYVTEENRKDTDAWVMKLTPLGEVLWNETFGGPDVNISAFAAAGTSDGGYIIAGETAMWGEPDTDALVIKLNSSGYEEWTRTFGEPGRNDSAYAVVETGSGEIGVAGSTESFESFGTDAFILKINSSGNELWNVTFGGPENDTARSIVLAPDGDFVFAGSYMSRTTPNTTEDDALVVKMDPDGEVVWNWTYGNPDENESAETIIATLDSGYLFAGRSGNLSLDNNAWVVKLDSLGAVEGDLTIGGVNPGDRAASVIQTAASEYVFAGTFNNTELNGTQETDAWVVKLATIEKTVTQPPAKPPKPPRVCPVQCPTPTPKPKPAPKTGCIGDIVWNDTNANGIQDKGEKVIPGVNVTLLDARQRTVANKTTTSRGYSFSGLKPGDYYVRFSLPQGYAFTIKDAGRNDRLDSDANLTTGRTDRITLKAGEWQCWWDAGLIRQQAPPVVNTTANSTISGFVWNDTDGNSLQGAGEEGIADAGAGLYRVNETLVNSTTTDANGTYKFNALSAGDYYLIFTLPDGFNFTSMDQGSDDALDSDADPATGRTENITLAENETQPDWDAGANVTTVIGPVEENATIGDFVWNDTNANGLQDEGEEGIPGVRVWLLYENESPVTDAAGAAVETTTGEEGYYTLQGVVGTTYIVEVMPPEGFTFVAPDAGDDMLDSDFFPETGRTGPFELTGEDLTRDGRERDPGCRRDGSCGDCGDPH
ncbi:MAG: hypothetical protein CVV31_09425 [Methanomicrobiales archaeon HGW-Methanomicrobiales-2]|nr:MAG: hypothetical protein CVV31_09425 [Methanomicrobiales archaeon HGW-Methanomicrobiales-2]